VADGLTASELPIVDYAASARHTRPIRPDRAAVSEQDLKRRLPRQVDAICAVAKVLRRWVADPSYWFNGDLVCHHREWNLAVVGGPSKDAPVPLSDVPIPDAVSASLPPGRDTVLEQYMTVDSDRWRRELAKRQLPAPTGLLGQHGLIQISRKDLFTTADMAPTPERAIQLLYASLAWGLGISGPYMTQRLNGVARHPDRAADLLVKAWRHVREGADPQTCYEDLITPRGAGRIHGNGPSFATKFLYFANGTKTSTRCVILDLVVAQQLRDLGVWPRVSISAWRSNTYARYCDLMTRWADEATARFNRRIQPDEVAYGLASTPLRTNKGSS
jgi:hypothetical protein